MTFRLTNKEQGYNKTPQSGDSGYVAEYLSSGSILDLVATTVNTRNRQKCYVCVEKNDVL